MDGLFGHGYASELGSEIAGNAWVKRELPLGRLDAIYWGRCDILLS
jgi:hypothetical protein